MKSRLQTLLFWCTIQLLSHDLLASASDFRTCYLLRRAIVFDLLCFLFVCYDVCYHYNITGKQLQLWSCNFNIIDGHCSKIMCILFARGQHPAAGCGARFVVPGTTRCYYPSIHPFINTLKAAVIIKYKNTSIIIIVIIKPCRKVVALRDAACFCLSVRLFVCRTKRI